MRKKATIVAVLITLVAALVATFNGSASAATTSAAASVASAPCGKVPNQHNYSKSQVATFDKAAKKAGYSSKQIAYIVHCKGEDDVATRVVAGHGSKKAPNPGVLLRTDAAGKTSSCYGWTLTNTAYAYNAFGAKGVRFAATTSVCFAENSKHYFTYPKQWTKAENDQHVKPYTYGWAVLWDYDGLASFGNYQMFDYDGNWTVSRTGNFKFHFGIGSFAITHHITLDSQFDFTTKGVCYFS